MSFCAAFGCSNQSNNNKDVSFHTMPKEENLRKAWFIAIGRTELPKNGRLCSAHFTSECFEPESQLKLQLCPELFKDRTCVRRRLKPGAVPTVFPHKDSGNQRATSLARIRRAEHASVSNIILCEGTN